MDREEYKWLVGQRSMCLATLEDLSERNDMAYPLERKARIVAKAKIEFIDKFLDYPARIERE